MCYRSDFRYAHVLQGIWCVSLSNTVISLRETVDGYIGYKMLHFCRFGNENNQFLGRERHTHMLLKGMRVSKIENPDWPEHGHGFHAWRGLIVSIMDAKIMRKKPYRKSNNNQGESVVNIYDAKNTDFRYAPFEREK